MPQAATAGSNGYGPFTLGAAAAGPTPPPTARRAIQELGAGETITDSFTAMSIRRHRHPAGHGHHPRHQRRAGDRRGCRPAASRRMSRSPRTTCRPSAALTHQLTSTRLVELRAAGRQAGCNGYGPFTLGSRRRRTYTAANAADGDPGARRRPAPPTATPSHSTDGTRHPAATVTIHGTNDVPVIGEAFAAQHRPGRGHGPTTPATTLPTAP